ncbi:MAG: YggT family protein [bacterium]|nr:YggT family protein [bacterium]
MNLLVNLLELYSWVLIVRILMSWFNPNPDNQIVQILYRVTEPVLAPVRNILPAMGGFDLSPLLVFFAIRMLQRVLLSM